MQNHADKGREYQSRAVQNQPELKKQGSQAAFQFVDNRPDAVQLRNLQEMADNSPQAEATAQLQAMADKSPRMVVQRQQLERILGASAQRQEVPQEEELQMKTEFASLQRQAELEDEEPLQGKFAPVQRQGDFEEEGLLQGKFKPVQRQDIEEDEPLQGKFAIGVTPAQLRSEDGGQEDDTGLPDGLKAGIENLSGVSLGNVNVHYNSGKPGQLQALAYTQGTDIHLGPGQEQHLPHEAWHVAQQRQGRVVPTMQMAGTQINDDTGLEHEADLMGEKAANGPSGEANTGLRMHNDTEADALKDSMSARAFTTGQAIFFKQGQKATLSSKGIIQRLSEAAFIKDTTTTVRTWTDWIGTKKREGDSVVLATLEEKLRIFDRATELFPRIVALKDLDETLQPIKAERGTKFYVALQKVRSETRELLIQLQKDPAYVAYAAELESRKKAEEKAARELKEQELLGKIYSEATEEERDLRLKQYEENNSGLAARVSNITGTMSEEDALKQLLTNFFSRTDFTYTFSSSSAFSGSGDCQTLRNEYIQIARNALGIKLDAGDTKIPVFIRGGGPIIDKNGLTGNVDGGAHWLFEEHHWATWQGTDIDVLYGQFGQLKQSVPGAELKNAPQLGYQCGGTSVYVPTVINPDGSGSYTLKSELARSNPDYKG